MTTPSIPAPRTWAAGPVATNFLRNDVTNGVAFLSARPLFMAYNLTAAVSVPANGTSNVPLDAEIVDTWNGHSPAIDNTLYVCQVPGWYFTSGVVAFNYTSMSQAVLTNQVVASNNGTSINLLGEVRPAGNGFPPGLAAFDLIPLAVTGTDFIRVVARNAGSTAVSLLSTFPTFSYLSTRWAGALSGTGGLPVPANTAWPAPPAIVTSAFLNSNIRDTLRFLTYPPMFRGYLAASSGPSLPSQAFPASTVVALDTASGSTAGGGLTVDNYSGWQAGSHSWQAPAAGVYTVAGQVCVTSGGGTYAVGFSVNGTVTWVKSTGDPVSSQVACICGARRVRLNAGDRVALVASQSSGGTVSLVGSGSSSAFCKLVIFWESA